ncbi:MAG: hypothetical protein ACAI34_18240 [Verrucomicrobium sp.]
MKIPFAPSGRVVFLLTGLLLVAVLGGVGWMGLDTSETELPTLWVTPTTAYVMEEALLTQHEKYSMLRLRGRWIGDNLALSYRIRPSLEGMDHLESQQGSVWYTSMMKATSDEPGHPFSLDIKNPPWDFRNLQVKVTFQRKEPYLVPVLEPFAVTVPNSLVKREPLQRKSAADEKMELQQARATQTYLAVLLQPWIFIYPTCLVALYLMIALPKRLVHWWQERC